MERIRTLTVIAVAVLAFTAPAFTQESTTIKKLDPQLFAGMKEAIADLEKGMLVVKSVAPPAPPWATEYHALLTAHGISTTWTDNPTSRTTGPALLPR